MKAYYLADFVYTERTQVRKEIPEEVCECCGTILREASTEIEEEYWPVEDKDQRFDTLDGIKLHLAQLKCSTGDDCQVSNIRKVEDIEL